MTEADWTSIKAALQAPQPFQNFMLTRRNKKGKLIYISLTGEPIFDTERRFSAYRGVGKDVTRARELARKALAESEERFRQLSGLTADWYWEQGQDLRYTGVDESRHFKGEDVALQGHPRWEIPLTPV